MKTAVLLTGISAATVLLASTSFGQFSAAEATTTISAAETVNQSQQAPVRNPKAVARYGNQTQTPQAPKAAALPPTGRATQLASPAALPPQQSAPARNPKAVARYGSAGVSQPSQPQSQAPGQLGAPQQPVYVAPVAAPRLPDPDREQRIVDFQRQKAISGNPTSQYDLGMRYLKGDGVEQDRTQALNWLGLAEKGGNSRAKKQMQLLAKEPVKETKAKEQPAKSE